MGQAGIPSLNKVGNSMFWSSMWDSKIMYSRFLKEDIFLNKFFDLVFNDALSVNLANLKKKNLKHFKKYTYKTDLSRTSIYKFLFNNNKIDYYTSKLWVLKFQKWVIVYHFIYIPNLQKLYNKQAEKKISYKNNIVYSFKYFKKANNIILNNCNYITNNPKLLKF